MQYNFDNHISILRFKCKLDLRLPNVKIALWHTCYTYMIMASDKPKHVAHKYVVFNRMCSGEIPTSLLI